MSRRAGVTVIDFTSALHNYRRDPSPDNLQALMRAGDAVCTHLCQVSEQLELASAKPEHRDTCKCRGKFKPASESFPIPAVLAGFRAVRETCDWCGVHRLTILVQVAKVADAG